MVQRTMWGGTAALTLFLGCSLAQAQPDDANQTLRDSARQLVEEHDYAHAHAIVNAAIAQGNSEALAIFGQMYLDGQQGVQQDYARAYACFKSAAAQGNANGLFNLGMLYWQGRGVTKQPQTALAYFEAARKAGNMKAGRYIGLYHEQHGQYARAVADYRQAADAGDITSQYYLGRAYQQGKGVKRDYSQALMWYTKAASRGDHVAADGMVGLASLYEHGQGVTTDLPRAKALYAQAAQLGNHNAQAALKRLMTATP